MSTVRIGRRPIHDRDRTVVAYELRSAHVVRGSGDPDERADLFVAGMVDVGLDRLSGGLDLVVALPDDVVRDGALAHLPLDRIVLDVRGEHDPDDDVRAMLSSTRRDGLRLRVADPVAHPHLADLAEHADVVAVQVGLLSPDERRERRRQLRDLGATLLAAGVHDHRTHRDVHGAGYELFSGTVLSTPDVVAGTRLDSDRVALLRLMALLADSEAGVDDLEAAVTASPTLSVQLLRYVNSAHVGLRQQVTSVRHAIVLVGPPVLRQLAGVLLLLRGDDKPDEAARVALSRAEACATVGAAIGGDPARHRTVGLLSAVDLLLDVPVTEAIADLPLSTDVVAALVDREGDLGRVLHAVRRYESCDWDDPVLDGFDPAVLAEAYFSGLSRADKLLTVSHEL